MYKLKIFFIYIITMMISLISHSNVQAESIPVDTKHIGVVIIGESEFKIGSCYRAIRRKFSIKDKPELLIDSSDEVQSKYLDYWAKKGFLEEQDLTQKDMLAFVQQSDYDKVIYLIMGESFNNARRLKARNLIQKLLTWNIKVNAVDVGMYATLYDKEGLVKDIVVVKEASDYNGDILSLQMEAFKKCLTTINKEFADKL